MSGNIEGESPSSNLMEVKDREAQGQSREGLSERSVEQRHEPTNRNWEGGTFVRARRPYPSRRGSVNPAGERYFRDIAENQIRRGQRYSRQGHSCLRFIE